MEHPQRHSDHRLEARAKALGITDRHRALLREFGKPFGKQVDRIVDEMVRGLAPAVPLAAMGEFPDAADRIRNCQRVSFTRMWSGDVLNSWLDDSHDGISTALLRLKLDPFPYTTDAYTGALNAIGAFGMDLFRRRTEKQILLVQVLNIYSTIDRGAIVRRYGDRLKLEAMQQTRSLADGLEATTLRMIGSLSGAVDTLSDFAGGLHRRTESTVTEAAGVESVAREAHEVADECARMVQALSETIRDIGGKAGLVDAAVDAVLGAARSAGAATDILMENLGEISSAVNAIRAVATGQKFILPEMAQKLAFLDPGRRDFLSGLNSRELEILRLLRGGKSMAEIAGVINVSYKTVANSCAVLKRKLGARTPLDLVRIAVENKLA